MKMKRIMVFAALAAVLMISNVAFAADEVGTGSGGGTVPVVSAVAEGVFFEIKADKPSFTPSEITLKKGQKVTLKFTSLDVDHSVDLSEFGIKKEVLIPEKQSVTVEFTPDKTGAYSVPCKKFCGWRHLVGRRPRLEIKVVE